MQIKTEFPYPIREISHIWIPLSDGCRLAARIWLPIDAEEHPVPAILEYIPYRKNDVTAPRDATRHPYFAGHGYASLRVDLRGTGDSDGILYDEYLKQEQDDCLEVIAWIAAQPWCSGSVGMIGISWGGFNGLQVAARRPAALAAVISLCSTDDRYADDVHAAGGCLLAGDSLPWASIMFSYTAQPPDPAVVGERWRDLWLDRLERTPPYIHEWLRHQRRDAFWQHGSVCEGFSAITCPIYAVGGWADGYTNAIPRLLAGLSCPRKGLIGPWSHNYPEQGIPGPAIGFLQECLRWWDHWLKGIDTGIMAEPMLRAWMQESVEPRPFYTLRPGRWVAEPSWPSPQIAAQHYFLTEGALAATPGTDAPVKFSGLQATGMDGPVFCPYGTPSDLALDQRAEDGRSLCFTTTPYESSMEVLGFPELTLTLSVDRPQALIAARLCDVNPDGASTLVSFGMLNLTHHQSHEHPTALEPGKPYTVAVRLNAIGHVLRAGHRWRIALSPTYWPLVWPSPEPVTITLVTGAASRLELPVRQPRAADETLAPFGPPEGSPPLLTETTRSSTRGRHVHYDVASGRHTSIQDLSSGGSRLPDGLEYDRSHVDTFTIISRDPLSAEVCSESTISIGRGAWRTRIEAFSTMSSNLTSFHITSVLTAYEGAVRVFAKTWSSTVPRDHC